MKLHNTAMKTLSILFLISGLILAQVRSKDSTIRGNIKDYDNGQPLIGATVLIKNTNFGAATDVGGNFSFAVPAGRYNLRISMVGYEELSIDNAIVAANAVTRIDTSLKEKAIQLQSQIITPKLERFDANGLTAQLNRNTIMRAPGSAEDIFWTLQTLPGVSSGSDMSELYVRGGDPSENLTLFDGATITNPYHFELEGGGTFSVFNSRLIDKVEFYEGGFPARYGDRLSSVLAITNKTASRDSLKGEVNLSLTDLNGIVEFPLKDLNGSGIFSARRSYFDVIFKLFPDLKNESDATPYFYDFFGKLDFDLSHFGRLIFTGLNSYENMHAVFNFRNYPHSNGIWNFDGRNQSFGAKLNLILSDNAVNELNAYYSRNDKTSSYPENSYEDYNLKEYGIKNDLSLSYGENEIHLGGWLVFKDDIASVNLTADENIYTLQDYSFQGSGKTALYSAYAEDKVKMTDKLSFNAGLRFDYLSRIRKGAASPRFNLVYGWNEHMSMSFDYGWYYQSPLTYEAGVDPSLDFEKAESIGLGMKHQLTDAFSVDLELYNKRYFDLVAYHNANQTLSSDGFGYARGAETYLTFKPNENLVGWISYSYSISKRKAGIVSTEQLFDYDRTHLISAVLNYKFSEQWSIGGKYRYGTGTPYTPVTGSYFDQSADRYFPAFGVQNSARYPAYSRLDLRLTRFFYLKSMPVEVYLEVLNVLDNQNAIHWMYSNDYMSKRFMTFFSTITPVIGVNLKI